MADDETFPAPTTVSEMIESCLCAEPEKICEEAVPIHMRDLAFAIRDALRNARKDERRACWEALNACIQPGHLSGNGTDKTAERNGLILACNILFDERDPAPPAEGAVIETIGEPS